MRKTFRKFQSFLLALLIAAPGMTVRGEEQPAYPAEVTPGHTVLAQNNFDNDNANLSFQYPSADTSVVGHDKEHGKSLRLGQVSGHKYIGKYFPGGLDDGRYCFSFSIYCENLENIKLIRLYDENAQDVTTANNSSMVFTWSGGSYSVRRTSSWITDYRLKGNYEVNKWYDVEMWIDTVNSEVTYKINGEVFVNMKYLYDVKKIKGFSLVQEQQTESDKGTYIDNLLIIKEDNTVSEVFDSVCIKADPGENVIGNNFYNNLLPSFSVSYANRLDSDKSFKISYSAVDLDGVEFWSSDDDLTLGKTETVVKKVDIPKKHYGVNKLIITLESEDEEIVKEVKYSLSNNSSDNPRNINAGACTHLSRAYGRIEEAAPILANAGFGVMRGEELPWLSFEQQKGVLKLSDGMKKNIDYFNKYGLKYIQICNSAVSFYQPEGIAWNMPVSTPEGYKALERYARELAKAAGDTLLGIEVWNEYHNAGFAGPFSTNPDVFAQLHRSIYKGLQSAGTGALTIGFDEDPWGFIETQIIQKTLDVLGDEKAMDAVSLHPYALDGSALENNERLDGFVGGTLDAMKQHGYSDDTPLYITEFGWSDSLFNFDYEKRAAYIIRAMAYYSAKYPNLATLCNYNLFDYADVWSAGNISEGTFGLVESYDAAGTEIPHLAKPLYTAFAYWNNLAAGNKFIGYVDGIDSQKEAGYIFKDRNGENYMILANLEENDKNIGIKLGVDSVTVSDIYGNEKKLYGVDGVFSFRLNKNRVIYVRGNFEKAEKTQAVLFPDKTEFNIPKGGSTKVLLTAPKGFNGNFECEWHDTLSSASGGDIKNGSAEAVLRGLEVPKDGKIKLSVTSGGKLYYETEASVTYSPSGKTSDVRIENTGGNTSLWDVVFNVENIRNDRKISGTVTDANGKKLFKLPSIWMGETREIRIPYKKVSNVGDIGDFDVRLNFDTGDYTDVSESFKICAAEFTDKPITVDGVLSKDEWKENTATIVLNEPSSVRSIQKYGGAGDLSAKIFLKYDLENFYLAADVTDDVFYQPNNNDKMWAGDSLQFSIAFDYNSANTSQYAAGLSADLGACIYRYAQEGNAGGFAGEAAMGLFTDGECAVKREGVHTYYEVKIPWDKMKVDGGSVYKGKKLYFAAIVNDDDNDGTGRGWIQLCNAIGNSNNSPAVSNEMYLVSTK